MNTEHMGSKKVWTSPQLTEYGVVEDLTQAPKLKNFGFVDDFNTTPSLTTIS